MARACGASRVAYNWALDWWGDAYRQWLVDPTSCDRPSEAGARLHLNMVKGELFPWMAGVTKCAPQEAVRDLGRAFANFFAGRAGFPRRHKKGVHDAFRVSSGFFVVAGDRLRLPHVGWVRMRERLRWPDARVVSVTVSRRRGRWFASLACDLPEPGVVARPGGRVVGVDVGTRGYALSSGEMVAVPRAYRRARRRLRRAQQSVARKQKGSRNRAKARARLARVHGVVADARAEWLHQLTHRLACDFDVIGVEDLNVKGMTARPAPRPDPDRPGVFLRRRARAKAGLAMSILDAGFGEFRRQLEYKCPERGVRLVVADRWYPSSTTCSGCGARTKRLTSLRVRQWTCESCGTSHHRDTNAAINLERYAARSAVSACGEFPTTDDPAHASGRHVTSMKQEPSIRRALNASEEDSENGVQRTRPELIGPGSRSQRFWPPVPCTW